MQSTRTTNRRRAMLAAGSVLALTALTACSSVDEGGSGEDGGGGALAELQDAGSITLAFNGEKPYSYEEDDGTVAGGTIALHEEVFSELGIDEIDPIQSEWDAQIPGLTAGRFDAVSSGMSITPERCEQAAFSEPEIMYTTSFLVPEGNPDGLENWQSVEGTDLTIAVTNGAVEDGFAADTDVETIKVGNSQDGLDAVVTGRADAFALTGISLQVLAEESSEAVEATEPFIAEINGVPFISAGSTVFRPGDTDLLDAYNEAAAEIIGDPDRYAEVLGPFGFTEAMRPPEGLTAEMLCDPDADLAAIAEDLGLGS